MKTGSDISRVAAETRIASATSFAGTACFPQGLMVGLDVGSTTVKAVVTDPVSGAVLWKDYQRHETRQPEKCLEFLERIEGCFPELPASAFRIFATGSGSGVVARHIGARFVQEVIAVSLAVEKLHPEVQSVVELGGQDAKIIVFKTDETTGRRKKIPSMNDKCAGGTGAVLDKINAKLRIPAETLAQLPYDGVRLHPVAGKCGVFAETDINGLQKLGVPPQELMASLFEAIVQQNLSVLTRGHTLRPVVLLLGGPNHFIRGLQECWRHNIPPMWRERGAEIPEGKSIEELIFVPDDAHYYAALGAVEFGLSEIQDEPHQGVYRGTESLRHYMETGRSTERGTRSIRGLLRPEDDLEAFRRRYSPAPWHAPRLNGGSAEVFIGIDGGSTSTKAVAIDSERRVLAKAYQLSKGNPIEDTVELLGALRRQLEGQGVRPEVLAVGTTGYAKDILKDVIGADVALVETVAHTESGLHYFPKADVICDVGGQDIKLILLMNGAVKDFKLNTQCSAGNGYFLQATAAEFGYAVEDYADAAFSAESMPEFGYGCAVFMQSDIVDFQRQGWRPSEILAGLAAVLPKNIWLYVSQIPNLAQLGRTFVLQGGTQRNLAAVKAQVDFIEARFAGTGIRPEIIVHPHCGESGAIGCAFEAMRLHAKEGHQSTFIGFDAAASLRYTSARNEETRCDFCKNRCLRTFIDVTTHADGGPETQRRFIVATCEKGAVENVDEMREVKRALDAVKKANPNLAEASAREAFKPVQADLVGDPPPVPAWYAPPRRRRDLLRRRELMERRAHLRIGMPRVLNLYAHAPFFQGFFQSLGIPGDRIVWSEPTSDGLYREGSRRGSIDPCFPSKLGIPHVHDLLFRAHTSARPLTHVFFPMVHSFPTPLEGVQGCQACPAAAATVEATHAAFIKEADAFAQRGIVFKKTFLKLDRPDVCAAQIYEDWADDLGLGRDECVRAVREGLRALTAYGESLRGRARVALDELERAGRIGIVLLARPYHNDPGVNHGIAEEFQKLGYPVFTLESLPLDEDILDRLFGDEVAAGAFASPLSIEDAWKNSFSENTSRRIWGAKYVARHPNLVALELSSFKCGHDAPTYSVVEQIIECSGTPHFSFKDIDENKPRGSLKIRVETIAYFLKRYRERLAAEAEERVRIEARLRKLEAKLQAGCDPEPDGTLSLV